MSRAPRSSELLRVFRHLAPELAPYRSHVLGAALCTLGVTAMQLLTPWPVKLVFDAVLMPQPGTLAWLERLGIDVTNQLMPLIASTILITAVLLGLFSYGQSTLAAGVGQKVVARIRYRVYAHLQRLPLSFHESTATGDLLARLTGDIRIMRELLVNAGIFIVDRSIAVVAMLVIMALMNWQLTLIALAIVPLLAITVVRRSDQIKSATRKQRRRESEITQRLHEKLTAISLVQSFVRESYEEERFAAQNNSSARAALVTTRLEANMDRLVQVLLAAGTTAVIWFGVGHVQSGNITPGDLLVFSAYLAGLYKPVRKLAAVTGRLAKATASGERIIAVLETEPAIRDLPDAIEAPPFRGEIALREVVFGYGRDETVLRDASVRIAAGEMVALMGSSGAGKSTIASLLFRFYEPAAGTVEIDGLDIRRYQLASLRRQIAVVPQNALLFNTSIRENIAYGRPNATDADIEAAARAAGVTAFVHGLRNGYDTIVGERGDGLSGGQRQRICIARALVQRTPIILFDEPTSGLDRATRNALMANLPDIVAGRTCLLITHDPELAAIAPRVLRLAHSRLEDVQPGELDNVAVLSARAGGL
ncbi:MAG: ABC transporter ATP-binding protein [Pseudomonadales bacterium]